MRKKIEIVILIFNILGVVTTIVGFIMLLTEMGVWDDSDGGESTKSAVSSTINNKDVKSVMSAQDEQMWKSLTGNVLTQIPSDKNPSNASEIEAAVRKKIKSIKIPIRTWKNVNDNSNMETVKKEVTLDVNSTLAGVWQGFFEDLYKEAPDFVITSVYGFRIDGTGYGQIGFLSGHTYGAAVDINADNNPYGEKQPYSKAEWESLEENHLKYQLIYVDSPMVKVAHKYTLLWGGEWSGTTKDIMHFSFICDGSSRAERIQKYGN